MVGEAVSGAGSRAFLDAALPGVMTRIENAARRAGRDPQEIRLMAVTKGFPRETVGGCDAAGVSLLGENRVQEAEQKYVDLPGALRAPPHRSSAEKQGAGSVGAVRLRAVHRQGGDRVALESRRAERGRTMDILLELNTSGEEAKSGFAPGRSFLLPWAFFPGCLICGAGTDDGGSSQR